MYKFKINGKEYKVSVGRIAGGRASVNVNGVDYEVEVDACKDVPAAHERENDVVLSPAAQAAPAAAGGRKITSPLPGVIIGISVTDGQEVRKGQRIAVVEAMKMENEILAPADGKISGIKVSMGDAIAEGAEIATII